MSALGPAAYAPVALLLVAGFLAACFQTLRMCHALSGRREPASSILADMGILVHLVVLCLLFRCGEEQAAVLEVYPGGTVLVPDLLWANLAVGVLVARAACREGRAAWLASLLPLAATLPCTLCVCGRFWPLVAALDLAFFGVRMTWPYLNGRRWGGQGVGAASPSEVLNLLPHGVLCASEWGTVLLLNTTMRDVLASLGLKTDLGDARAMFRALAPDGASEQRALLLDDGRCFLVSVDYGGRQGDGVHFAIAFDVSEEAHVNQQLAEANDELACQNAKLSRMLQNVLAVAGREASLQMRGAVHDIVGQRLSILHRHLEDRELDDATIAALRPLLSDLIDDLRPVSSASPKAELAALEGAFGDAGIATDVTGELADDEEVARLQVRVIREAMSNALRHGNARQVTVALGHAGECATVHVENDGAAADAIIEGSGLTGLRRAVEERGGSFSITGKPRFALEAAIPS